MRELVFDVLVPWLLVTFTLLAVILSSSVNVDEWLDCFLDGPCGHWLEKGGRVGVVCHRHILVAITVVLVQVQDVARVGDGRARVEDLRHFSPFVTS